jgi:hypothetical protein
VTNPASPSTAVVVSSGIPGAEWLTPATMEQGMQLANLMADCTLVPDHLKKKPGDCFPILVQALRWRMDPFAVAQATAVVRGKLCYEGKLVHAVLISMGAIDGRLSFDYDGAGDNRKVIVTGTPKGDKPRSISGTVKQWKTDNGNWMRDPDMMLAYRGTRAWARLYCPDAMLGVYTPDEAHEGEPREVEATVHGEPRPAKTRTIEASGAPADPPADGKPADTPPAEQGQGAATDPPAGQKPEPTTARCQEVTEALMKRGAGGKALVAGIMKRWKLAVVRELDQLTNDDRQAYIDEVGEADAKLEPVSGGKA